MKISCVTNSQLNNNIPYYNAHLNTKKRCRAWPQNLKLKIGGWNNLLGSGTRSKLMKLDAFDVSKTKVFFLSIYEFAMQLGAACFVLPLGRPSGRSRKMIIIPPAARWAGPEIPANIFVRKRMEACLSFCLSLQRVRSNKYLAFAIWTCAGRFAFMFAPPHIFVALLGCLRLPSG